MPHYPFGEAEKRATDNTLSRDRVNLEEQGLSDLDYWRTFEDAVPDTVKFREEHGVKLSHYDEKNAAPRTGRVGRCGPQRLSVASSSRRASLWGLRIA